MRSLLLTLVGIISIFQTVFVVAKTDEKYPDFPEPLTKANFKETLEEGLHIVEFYSPYCSHCKHLAPIWKEAWKRFQDESKTLKVSFNQVNCIESGDICQEENIDAYPIIRLYNKDGFIKKYPDNGDRSVESFLKFARNEAKNPNNYDDVSLESQSVLLEDIDFVDMIAGKSKEPYLVSFWPTDEMVNVDSAGVEIYDCEDCSSFRRTWKQLSNRLVHAGIKTGHLNCVKYATLCKQLGFKKLTKKTTFDDNRHPAVAMVLPNKTTNNLFKFKGGFSTEAQTYEDFAISLNLNSKLPEITSGELKNIMKHSFDFDKNSIVPIDKQNTHIVFAYDPKTVVPEDYDIFEYLLEPLSKLPNIRLYQSKENILDVVKTGFSDFSNRINYNMTEKEKFVKEEYVTMSTLTQLPTFILFKDGDLIPKVFHGYSTTEMRNQELIMKWIKENSLPHISKVDSSNVERLINFKSDLYNTLTILCVGNDDPNEKEKKNLRDKERVLENFITAHYDYDNVRMNYMFEKILKRRDKKDAIIQSLKEKNANARKIVDAMRYEIFHEDNLQNILGFMDLKDVQEILEQISNKPLERKLEYGDVLIIDKNNRRLYVTKISGDKTSPDSIYALKETLLSINIPDQSVFTTDSDYLPLKIGRKPKSGHFWKNIFYLIIMVICAYCAAPWVISIIRNIKTNRSYKNKRNTDGLLGNVEKKA
ncbi:ER-retained PMA1-suppressing protein 1 [Monosporozyma servazzii]